MSVDAACTSARATSGLREGEDEEALFGRYAASVPAGCRYDRHVLLAVFSLIGDRNGGGRVVGLPGPELFAVPRVERAETIVVGRTDEDQAAGRRDGSGAVL